MTERAIEILRRARTIAVVGLSPNPFRPSHGVAAYLQSAGFRVIPVNPNLEQTLGERAYARLEDIPLPPDIVNVFRRSEFVPAIAESAISIGAQCLWLQEGVRHPSAAARAAAPGVEVVEDRCLLVEHRALVRAGRL